jgi:hypothetical protein
MAGQRPSSILEPVREGYDASSALCDGGSPRVGLLRIGRVRVLVLSESWR